MAEGQRRFSLLLRTFLKRTFLHQLFRFFLLKSFLDIFVSNIYSLNFIFILLFFNVSCLSLRYREGGGGNGRWNWIFMAVWIRDILSINSCSNWLQPFQMETQRWKYPLIHIHFDCHRFVPLSKRFSQLGEGAEQRKHYQLFTHSSTNAKNIDAV